jgi:hypothetical protein
MEVRLQEQIIRTGESGLDDPVYKINFYAGFLIKYVSLHAQYRLHHSSIYTHLIKSLL